MTIVDMIVIGCSVALALGFVIGVWFGRTGKEVNDYWAKHPDDMLHGEDVG